MMAEHAGACVVVVEGARVHLRTQDAERVGEGFRVGLVERGIACQEIGQGMPLVWRKEITMGHWTVPFSRGFRAPGTVPQGHSAVPFDFSAGSKTRWAQFGQSRYNAPTFRSGGYRRGVLWRGAWFSHVRVSRSSVVPEGKYGKLQEQENVDKQSIIERLAKVKPGEALHVQKYQTTVSF